LPLSGELSVNLGYWFREAEVGNFDRAIMRNQEIGRLHIAMNDSRFMSGG
jgi:hypothetical protein